MDPKIRRHIVVWAIATVLLYGVCVGLYVLLGDITPNIFNKPVIFLIQKLIASIIGISILTGVTIYSEVVSTVPIYTTLKEVPLALAVYLGALVYCITWIWNYS
jgi:hypothetical protein